MARSEFLITQYDPAVVRERVETPAEYRKMLEWLMPGASDADRNARWKVKFGTSHSSLRSIAQFHHIPKYTVVGTQADGNCLYRCFAKMLMGMRLVQGLTENQIVARLRSRVQDVMDVALAGITVRTGHADTVRAVYGLEEGEDRRDNKAKPFETVAGMEILAALCQVDVLLLYSGVAGTTGTAGTAAGELRYRSMFVSSGEVLDGMMTMGRGSMTLAEMDEWAQKVAAELRRPIHAPTDKRLVQCGTRGLFVLHGTSLSGQHLSGHFEIVRPTTLAMPLRPHPALARLDRLLNVRRMMSLTFTQDIGATIDVLKDREPLAKALGFGTSVLVNDKLALFLAKGSRFLEGTTLGNCIPADPRIHPFRASLFSLTRIASSTTTATTATPTLELETEQEGAGGGAVIVKTKISIDIKHREDEKEALLQVADERAAAAFTFHDGTPHEAFTDMNLVLSSSISQLPAASEQEQPASPITAPTDDDQPQPTMTPAQIATELAKSFQPYVRPAPEPTPESLPPSRGEQQSMDEDEVIERPGEEELMEMLTRNAQQVWGRDNLLRPMKESELDVVRDGFKVDASTIPDAGRGLFATKDMHAKTILGAYTGKCYSTLEEAEADRTRLGADPHSQYILNLTSNGVCRYVDGDYSTHPTLANIFAFINRPPTPKTAANVEFTNKGNVVAKRAIKAGEELFVKYGAGFKIVGRGETETQAEGAAQEGAEGQEEPGVQEAEQQEGQEGQKQPGVEIPGVGMMNVSLGSLGDVSLGAAKELRLRGRLSVKVRVWSEILAAGSYDAVPHYEIVDEGEGESEDVDVDVDGIRAAVAAKIGREEVSDSLILLNAETETALVPSDLFAIRLGMDVSLDLLAVLPDEEMPATWLRNKEPDELLRTVDIDLIPEELLPSRKDLVESRIARLVLFLVGAYRVGIHVVREIESQVEVTSGSQFMRFNDPGVLERFVRYEQVILHHLLIANNPHFLLVDHTTGAATTPTPTPTTTLGMECVAALFDEDDDEGLVVVKRSVGESGNGGWMMADKAEYHKEPLPLSLAKYTLWQKQAVSDLKMETFEWTTEVQDQWIVRNVRDLGEFAASSASTPLLSSPLLATYLPGGDLTPEILAQMTALPEDYESPSVVNHNPFAKTTLVKVGPILVQFSVSAQSVPKGWFFAAEALGGSRAMMDLPCPPQLVSVCRLRPTASWAVVMNVPGPVTRLSRHILASLLPEESGGGGEEGQLPSIYELVERMLQAMNPADRKVFEEQESRFGMAPASFLEMRHSLCSGNGIFATGTIPADTFLGIYTGALRRDQPAQAGEHYVWEITTLAGGSSTLYVDGDYRKHKTAGWLSVLNSAPTEDDANVHTRVLPATSKHPPRLAYYATRPIRPGDQLRVFYGPAYASFIRSKYVEVVDRACAAAFMMGTLLNTWHSQYRLCLGGGKVGLEDVVLGGPPAVPPLLRVPACDPSLRVILPYEHMVHASKVRAFDEACQEDNRRWSRDLMAVLMQMIQCNADPRNVFVDVKASRIQVAEAFMRGIDETFTRGSTRRPSVLHLTTPRQLCSVPFVPRDDLVRAARRGESVVSPAERISRAMLPVSSDRSRFVPASDGLIQSIDDDAARTMAMIKAGFRAKVGAIMRPPFAVLASLDNGLGYMFAESLDAEVEQGQDADAAVLDLAKGIDAEVQRVVRLSRERLVVAVRGRAAMVEVEE